MPRVATKVDGSLLSILFRKEDAKGHGNQNVLWLKVADAYNAAKGADLKAISPGVVRLRILESKTPINTPKGKRGRSDLHLSRGKKGKRSDKFKANPEIQEAFVALRKATPERFVPLVMLVEAGSLKAAVKMKCLDCSAGQTQEIRACPVNDCSLWAFRPYQGKAEVDEVPLSEAA